MFSDGTEVNEGQKAAPSTPGLSGLFTQALDKVLVFLGGAPPQPEASSTPVSKPTVWVDHDGADGTTGRILISWPQKVPLEQLIQKLPGVFVAPGLPGSSVAMVRGHAANDNSYWVGDTYWVGDENFDGIGGALGRDPTVAVLADGHTVVAWISDDNIVHASVYSPEAARHLRSAGDATSQFPTPQRIVLGEMPAAVRQNSRLSITPSDGSAFLILWAAEFSITAALIAKMSLQPADGADAAEVAQGQDWHTLSLPNPPAELATVSSVSVTEADGSFQVAYAVPAEDNTSTVEQIVKVEPSHSEGAVHFVTPADAAGPHHVSGSALPSSLFDEAKHVAADSGSPGEAAALVAAATQSSPQAETVSTSLEVSEGLGSLAALPVVEVANLPAPEQPAVQVTDPVPAGPDVALAGDTPVTTPSAAFKPVIAIVPTSPTTGTLTVTTPASGGAPVVLSEKALIADPNHAGLDLAPNIVSNDQHIAVAWVEKSEDGATTQLTVAVVTCPHGEDAAAEVTQANVAAASSPEDTISDISLALTSAPGTGPDLAILWVAGADSSGFGQVTAQLADFVKAQTPAIVQTSQADNGAPQSAETPVSDVVTQSQVDGQPATDAPADTTAPAEAVEPAVTIEPAGPANTTEPAPKTEIVFLGQDCTDNDDDAPFVLGEGRDPEATFVQGSDTLAIAWIAPPAVDQAYSTVQGAVLSLETGEFVQDLGLPLSLSEGGTGHGNIDDIEITSDSSGDIILSWLQDALGGGFTAMAAMFARASGDHWREPSVKELKHFAEKPLEITLVVEDGPNIDVSLSLTWTDGTGKYSTPSIIMTASVPDGANLSVLVSADDTITALPVSEPVAASGNNVDDHHSGSSNSGSGSGSGSGSSNSTESSSNNSGHGNNDSDPLKLIIQVSSGPDLTTAASQPVADIASHDVPSSASSSQDDGASGLSVDVPAPSHFETVPALPILASDDIGQSANSVCGSSASNGDPGSNSAGGPADASGPGPAPVEAVVPVDHALETTPAAEAASLNSGSDCSSGHSDDEVDANTSHDVPLVADADAAKETSTSTAPADRTDEGLRHNDDDEDHSGSSDSKKENHSGGSDKRETEHGDDHNNKFADSDSKSESSHGSHQEADDDDALSSVVVLDHVNDAIRIMADGSAELPLAAVATSSHEGVTTTQPVAAAEAEHASALDATAIVDTFVFATGFGHDAAVPDLQLNDSGYVVFGTDETPLSAAFDFDMPLSEDTLLFDSNGHAIVEHVGWQNDLAMI